MYRGPSSSSSSGLDKYDLIKLKPNMNDDDNAKYTFKKDTSERHIENYLTEAKPRIMSFYNVSEDEVNYLINNVDKLSYYFKKYNNDEIVSITSILYSIAAGKSDEFAKVLNNTISELKWYYNLKLEDFIGIYPYITQCELIKNTGDLEPVEKDFVTKLQNKLKDLDHFDYEISRIYVIKNCKSLFEFDANQEFLTCIKNYKRKAQKKGFFKKIFGSAGEVPINITLIVIILLVLLIIYMAYTYSSTVNTFINNNILPMF